MKQFILMLFLTIDEVKGERRLRSDVSGTFAALRLGPARGKARSPQRLPLDGLQCSVRRHHDIRSGGKVISCGTACAVIVYDSDHAEIGAATRKSVSCTHLLGMRRRAIVMDKDRDDMDSLASLASRARSCPWV